MGRQPWQAFALSLVFGPILVSGFAFATMLAGHSVLLGLGALSVLVGISILVVRVVVAIWTGT